MEAINDSTKLIAQSLDLLREEFKEAVDPQDRIIDSILMLEIALEKLTNKIGG